MKCFIYRNLHKKGCVYSIKALEGEFKGRIIGYSNAIIVHSAEFRVSEAGRNRVRREKKKNVHAGIVGDILSARNYEKRLCDIEQVQHLPKYPHPFVHITYNPYINDSFVDRETNEPVYTAEFVVLTNQYVSALLVNHPSSDHLS